MKSNIERSINKKTFIPKFSDMCQDFIPFLACFFGCYIVDCIFRFLIDNRSKKDENLS